MSDKKNNLHHSTMFRPTEYQRCPVIEMSITKQFRQGKLFIIQGSHQMKMEILSVNNVVEIANYDMIVCQSSFLIELIL